MSKYFWMCYDRLIDNLEYHTYTAAPYIETALISNSCACN